MKTVQYVQLFAASAGTMEPINIKKIGLKEIPVSC